MGYRRLARNRIKRHLVKSAKDIEGSVKYAEQRIDSQEKLFSSYSVEFCLAADVSVL